MPATPQIGPKYLLLRDWIPKSAPNRLSYANGHFSTVLNGSKCVLNVPFVSSKFLNIRFTCSLKCAFLQTVLNRSQCLLRIPILSPQLINVNFTCWRLTKHVFHNLLALVSLAHSCVPSWKLSSVVQTCIPKVINQSPQLINVNFTRSLIFFIKKNQLSPPLSETQRVQRCDLHPPGPQHINTCFWCLPRAQFLIIEES